MTTTYKIKANWPAIHEAFAALDRARCFSRSTGSLPIGHNGIFDALGGTYWGGGYEDHGAAGLVRLIDAERIIRHDAWDRLHAAAQMTDRKRAIATARVCCATAIALDDANRVLAATGLTKRAGVNTICGTDGTYIAVVGLGWLVGMRCDDKRTTLESARSFAETGDLGALREQLLIAPVDAAIYGNL